MAPVTLLKVWDASKVRCNFAFAVTVPFIWNRASATKTNYKSAPLVTADASSMHWAAASRLAAHDTFVQ